MGYIEVAFVLRIVGMIVSALMVMAFASQSEKPIAIQNRHTGEFDLAVNLRRFLWFNMGVWVLAFVFCVVTL